MAQKFSPNDAEMHLSVAKRWGHIFGYERIVERQPVRFLIDTVPTHYDHYHNPEAQGQIVLTTREVMAFTEGIYAASRVQPRPEDDTSFFKPVEGERLYPTRRAGDAIR